MSEDNNNLFITLQVEDNTFSTNEAAVDSDMEHYLEQYIRRVKEVLELVDYDFTFKRLDNNDHLDNNKIKSNRNTIYQDKKIEKDLKTIISRDKSKSKILGYNPKVINKTEHFCITASAEDNDLIKINIILDDQKFNNINNNKYIKYLSNNQIRLTDLEKNMQTFNNIIFTLEKLEKDLKNYLQKIEEHKLELEKKEQEEKRIKQENDDNVVVNFRLEDLRRNNLTENKQSALQRMIDNEEINTDDIIRYIESTK